MSVSFALGSKILQGSCPLQFSQAVFPSPTKDKAYPEASSIVVGDGFYQAVQYLPDRAENLLFSISAPTDLRVKTLM